jgi:exodeoxyribonuclease VII large subunit
MGKKVKSQWDFGELFPPEQLRSVLSVTELTTRIRQLLEQHVGQVWVSGEITNLRFQSSGHVYFGLKDASAQLSCVLFRGELQVDRSLLQDGRKVTLRGDVTVYEAKGQYQLRVTEVELQGMGALQMAFEKLKQRLSAEGLFAQERKRPLPRFPRRLGLVTSPTGAAIKDVFHVVQRRNPSLEIILAPSRVQGDGAAKEIAAAIVMLNEFNERMMAEGLSGGPPTSGPPLPVSGGYLDLILITRGGGSLEDLWAFNEEVVARAIFNSALPVVSAVGHEIDFTISDFVADLRAATPSAAAEIITEGVFSSWQFISQADSRLRQLLGEHLETKALALKVCNQRLMRLHPRRRLDQWIQRLDEIQLDMVRCARQGLRDRHVVWSNLANRLQRVRPAQLLKQRREVFGLAKQRLSEALTHRIDQFRSRLTTAEARLRLLGPEQVLARGYSITRDASTRKVLREAAEVAPGTEVETRLQKGTFVSTVKSDFAPLREELQQKSTP